MFIDIGSISSIIYLYQWIYPSDILYDGRTCFYFYFHFLTYSLSLSYLQNGRVDVLFSTSRWYLSLSDFFSSPVSLSCTPWKRYICLFSFCPGEWGEGDFKIGSSQHRERESFVMIKKKIIIITHHPCILNRPENNGAEQDGTYQSVKIHRQNRNLFFFSFFFLFKLKTWLYHTGRRERIIKPSTEWKLVTIDVYILHISTNNIIMVVDSFRNGTRFISSVSERISIRQEASFWFRYGKYWRTG